MTFLHTLSTAYAPKTHVKAPQTDFPVKSDNSSGPTYDRPLERPLRTKATFRHGKAPKRHRENHQAVREPPSQARTNSPPCSFRSEGRHRDQDDILIRAQSHGRSLEASGQTPWLTSVKSPKPSRLGSDRSGLPIPWIGIAHAFGRTDGPEGRIWM